MRSRSGWLIVSSWFAVQMNMTLREVDRDLDVVIDEVLVLLGVEHLEHGSRRITPHVRGELVDLVEHEHGIHRPGLLETSDDTAGQGTDIRATVTANLRLVTHAAERDADVLAAERLAIDLPSDVLPTPGGPTSSRIGPCLFMQSRNTRSRWVRLDSPSSSRRCRP